MLPAGDQVPVNGSNSSALASAPVLPNPPAASTLPSGSGTAVNAYRGVAMLPVAVHAPGTCATLTQVNSKIPIKYIEGVGRIMVAAPLTSNCHYRPVQCSAKFWDGVLLRVMQIYCRGSKRVGVRH